MSYTAIMAHTYSGDPHSVIGWYASRKLNGNRAVWNGKTLQTLGRYSGSKIFYPPAWWSKSALPAGVPLDGELWHINDDKDLVRSIAGQGIGKSVVDPRWADIRYMVFDYKPYSCYPDTSIEMLPPWASHKYWLNYNWLERQRILQSVIGPDRSNLILCKQTPMNSTESVKSVLDESLRLGWEGIVFANPQGEYTCKRSHDLLKSKPLYDHECYTNGIEMGEGRHIGRVGALKCFLTWNEQVTSFKGGRDDMIGMRVSFNVGGGLTDDLRESFMENRPNKIRFSFLEVSKVGIPQSPNYLETV
jgi:DNA ligase-1